MAADNGERDVTGVGAVLAIGGTDSSGGAGLTRDAEVLAECGVASAFVVTAVTAQTDARVVAVRPMPSRIVREQIRAALEAHAVRAVKIGMLGTHEVIRTVADALRAHKDLPLVLDPVLVASSGGALLDARALHALRETMFPRAALITPNVPEAAKLLDVPEARDFAGMTAQALQLRMLGPAVLLKGGHVAGAEATDVLVGASTEIEQLSSARLAVEMRGTGCMLASAIAAGLARGMPLLQACRFGKRYMDLRFAKALQRERGLQLAMDN
jgi:hydroxymethylpyrimidine/phosphomethylpyrimidine kinase